MPMHTSVRTFVYSSATYTHTHPHSHMCLCVCMSVCLPVCLPVCRPVWLSHACMQAKLQVANHRSLDGPQGLHLKNDICGVVAYEWNSPMTPTICFGRTVCQKLGSECSRVRGIVLASVCAECHQIQGAAPKFKGRKVTCYTLSVSACSCRLSCYVFHSFQTRSQRVFCCGENGRGQCGRSMQQQQRLCCIKVSLHRMVVAICKSCTSLVNTVMVIIHSSIINNMRHVLITVLIVTQCSWL